MLLKIIGSFFLTFTLGGLIALGTLGIPVISMPVEKEVSLKQASSS